MVRAERWNASSTGNGGSVLSLNEIVERELLNQRRGETASADILDELAAHGFATSELFEIIVPRRTLARRRHTGMRLSADESGRAVRLARIAEMAERVFGDPAKAQRWLRKPDRALGGAVPLELLKSETGAYAVEQALHQIDHGIVV